MPPNDEDLARQPQGRASLLSFLVIFGFFCILTVKMILPYLMALIMGAILAILARPLYRRFQNHGMGEKAAAAVVTILTIILVVGPILVFSSLAIKQGINFGQQLANDERFSVQAVIDKIAGFNPLKFFFGEASEIELQLKEALASIGAATSNLVLTMAKSIPDIILQLALASMACFFFLADGPAFFRWVSARLPLDLDIRNKLAATFKDTAISVVWASMAAAGTQAVMMSAVYSALGVPGAFLAGGATFIFAWIPILGSTPVWLTGAIILYSEGAPGKMVVMLVIGGLTGLIDNVVRPYVLKGRSEMHPLVSLVAIFGGIQMFGLFGVLMGPILMAIVISLLQIWPVVGQRFGLKFEGGGSAP